MNGTVKNIGTLYKKKKGKEYKASSRAKAPYYVRYSIDGKQKRQALRNENGDRIYNREEAEEARLRLLSPLLAKSKVEQRKAMLSSLRDAKEEVEEIEDNKNSIAIDKAWDAFLESPNRRDTGQNTLRQYRFQFARFVDWVKQNHSEVEAMAEVDSDIAKGFAKSLIAEGKSGNTFNKYIQLLRMVFDVLAEEAGIQNNPWQSIQRRQQNGKGRRELSTEELKEVCEATEGEMRLLFALGIYTGLRLKDCCLLEWDEVDLGRNRITRVPSKIARRKNELLPTKLTASSVAKLRLYKNGGIPALWSHSVPIGVVGLRG